MVSVSNHVVIKVILKLRNKYWVGPFAGSLIATAFYSVLKHIRYWRLNPDQDVSDPKKSPEGPVSNMMSNGRVGEYEDRGRKTSADQGSP